MTTLIVVLALALIVGLTPASEVLVSPAAAQEEDLPEPQAPPEIPDQQAVNQAAKDAAAATGGYDGDTQGQVEMPTEPAPIDPSIAEQIAADTDGEAYVTPPQEPQVAAKVEPANGEPVFDPPREVVPSDERDPAARTEVVDLRTEKSRTYDNGDGTYSTVQATEAVNVENPDGSFDPIDVDLEERDGKVRPKRGQVDIYLADSGADDLAVVKPTGGTELGYSLEGAADVPAQVDGNEVRYPSVLPGVDIELETMPAAIKETIVLASADAGSEFTFKVQGKGVKLRLAADGQVEWIDRTSGEVLAVIPRGWAVDAAGERTEAVSYSIKGRMLVVTLDEGWLRDPARQFPVSIDPTIGWAASSGDTTIMDCPQAANTNFSGSLELSVGYDDLFDCDRTALIKFDNLLPFAQALVFDAKLTMYNYRSPAACVQTAMYVRTIASDWDPATVTYNTRPSIYPAPIASPSFAYGCGSDAGQFITMPITSTVQQWASGALANRGLYIDNRWDPAVFNGDVNTLKLFESAETVLGPQLTITYSPYRSEVSASIAPPTVNTAGSAQVTVKNVGPAVWTTSDFKVTYKLYDAGGNPIDGAYPMASLPSNIGYNQQATVAVPISPVAPGIYRIRFNVKHTAWPYEWFGDEGSQSAQATLIIESTVPQVDNIGPAGSVPTSKPVLSVTARDPDSYPADALVYDFKWCTNFAMDAGCVTAANQSEGQYKTALSGGINWAQQYYWTVTVRHGSESITTSPLPLIAVITQPDLPSHLGSGNVDGGGVSLATGNYTATITDLQVEATGPELALTRTYNSMDPRSGTLFGRGFSSPYDMSFKTEPATDSALVTYPDGHQQRFGNNGGTYVGPPGTFDRIESTPSNHVTLTTGDGMKFVFQSSDTGGQTTNLGKLVEIANQNGQKVVLSWHATTGKLQTITSQPSGRVLTVTMTPTTPTHVQSVATAPVAANGNQPYRVDYTYSNDNLDTVCGPRSATECVDYTFGTDSGNAGTFNRLTKVVTAGANKPGPDFIANTTAVQLDYRPDGSVKTRTDAAGENTVYSDDRNQQGGLYHPVAPVRVTPPTPGTLANQTSFTASVSGRAGFPADPKEVRAVVFNLTVVGAAGSSGYVQVWETGRNAPPTSVANYNSVATTADQMVTIPVDDLGQFQVKHLTTGAAATVYVDLLGWYGEEKPSISGGLSYHGVNATRVIDTRTTSQVGPFNSVWPANGDREIQIANNVLLAPHGVPNDRVKAVAVNVQSVTASANGSMVAYASGTTAPSGVTTMRMWSSRSRANTVIVPVGADGKIRLKNLSGATSHIVVDVYGWFGLPDDFGDGALYQPAVDPQRSFDSRSGTRIGPFTTPWQSGTTRNVAMTGTGFLSSDGAVAINASLVAPATSLDRVLTAWPTDLAAPTGSSVVVTPGASVGNTILNRIAGDGSGNITNAGGAGDVLMDVYGAFFSPRRITVVGTPLGHQRTFSFDNKRHLVSSEDELGKRTTMKYTAGGQLSTVVDRSGSITTYGYDAYGRLAGVSKSEPCDYFHQGGWGPLFCPWRSEYLQYPSIESVPLGHPSFNKPIYTRDPRSASPTDGTYAKSYGYDAKGNQTYSMLPSTYGVNALQKITSFAYTSNTYVVGSATQKMPDGLLRTVRFPDNTEVRYDYDVKGDLVAEWGPYPIEVAGGGVTPHPESGSKTTHTYDELGRRLTSTTLLDTGVTPNQTATTTFTYDARGALLSETGPAVTDTVNNVTHQTRTATTYDANGNVVEVVASDVGGSGSPDPSRTSTTIFDAANRPVRFVAPATADQTLTYGVGSLVHSRTQSARTFEYAYSARGELTTTTLKDFVSNPVVAPPAYDLLVEARAYDDAGRLGSVIDAEGRKVELTYLQEDEVDTAILKDFGATGQAQRDITLVDNAYDKAGNLTERKVPKGNGANADAKTSYGYDEEGRLAFESTATGTANVDNRAVQYSYDNRGRATTVLNYGTVGGWPSFTEATTYTFEFHGQPATMSKGGLTTTFEYDVAGREKRAVDPAGGDTLTTYDALSRPVTISSPVAPSQTYSAQTPVDARAVVRTGYNTFNEPVAMKDPLNQVTRQAYDGAGRPTVKTFPSYTPVGSSGLPATPVTPTEATEFDELGRPKAFIDRRNQRTDLSIDPLGRVVGVQEPAVGGSRPVSLYWYDNSGDLIHAVDPRGTHAAQDWDDLDRMVRRTVAETVPVARNIVTDYGYDDAGNTTKVTDPTGVTVDLDYDNFGQLIKSRRPASSGSGTVASTTDYDFMGRPYTVRHEDNVRIERRYDAVGRPTSIQRFGADGTPTPATTIAYDVPTRTVTATDPRGFARTLQLDALNRPVATARVAVPTPVATTNGIGPITGPDIVTETVGYDLAGNVTRETDGRGNATWTTYNVWGLPDTLVEPSTTAHPSTANRTWSYGYDAGGLPIKEVAPGSVSRSRTFDELGRLTAESGSGAEAATVSRSLGYDLVGNVTSYATPAGNASITYNARNLPMTVTDPQVTTSYTYDDAGRTTKITGGPDAVNFTYNARGELATEKHQASAEVATWTYRDDGKPLSRSFGAGSTTQSWTYDTFGRLESSTLANGASTLRSDAYTYDDSDNITSKTVGPATVPGAGANGYTYDGMNRLRSWTNPASVVTNYGYDKASNRTTSGTVTAVYDERNRLTSSTDSATSTTTTYTWSARGTLATSKVGAAATKTHQFDAFDRILTDGSTTYTYDSLDRVRSRNGTVMKWEGLTQNLISEGSQGFTYDPTGRPLRQYNGSASKELVTDAHGDVVGSHTATGTALTNAKAFDPWGNVIATSGSTLPSIGYQGDWTDPTTGRVDANARFYTPATGTFTSRDSIDDPAMSNRYGYTAGNPLRFKDLSGHNEIAIGAEGIAAIEAILLCIESVICAVTVIAIATPFLLYATYGADIVGGCLAYTAMGNALLGAYCSWQNPEPEEQSPPSDSGGPTTVQVPGQYGTIAAPDWGSLAAILAYLNALKKAEDEQNRRDQRRRDGGDDNDPENGDGGGGENMGNPIGRKIAMGLLKRLLDRPGPEHRRPPPPPPYPSPVGTVWEGMEGHVHAALVDSLGRVVVVANYPGYDTTTDGQWDPNMPVLVSEPDYTPGSRDVDGSSVSGSGGGGGTGSGTSPSCPSGASVYHSTTSLRNVNGLFNGIDPRFLKDTNRFGVGFYTSEIPETSVKELLSHDTQPTHQIRYSVDGSQLRVLDLTDEDVARAWGYSGGPITPNTQAIGTKAAAAGFNAIRFWSERGPGANLAVIDDFNEILRPEEYWEVDC